MNTQENNKLIADFMGMKYGDERKFVEGEWIHSIQSLSRFRQDWNWLMEVVEKIDSIGYSVNISSSMVYINSDNGRIVNPILIGVKTKIECLYEAVLEFIKWFNEQK